MIDTNEILNSEHDGLLFNSVREAARAQGEEPSVIIEVWEVEV